MEQLGFNQRAGIAASLETLRKDRDCPVYIEGDLWTGRDYSDMDDGEAARIVVDAVLDHPVLRGILEERDALWRALKWVVGETSIPGPIPDEILPTVHAALDAQFIEDYP